MHRAAAIVVALLIGSAVAFGAPEWRAPTTLPVQATTALSSSLDAATRHGSHVWRDTPPINADGTVNGYIEIARGDRRKWEFDMGANRRAVDRTLPSSVGGYPVNYGFVPQTVSYDGDPFDVLVLGPPIEGGRLVRGVIVGLMRMEDEKGLDSKVVISPAGADHRPLHALTGDEQQRIGEYFKRYKAHEQGKFSQVPGWGDAAEGLSYVTTTHAFFTTCRNYTESTCTLSTYNTIKAVIVTR
jgi:inorganic pyrophosphatase